MSINEFEEPKYFAQNVLDDEINMRVDGYCLELVVYLRSASGVQE